MSTPPPRDIGEQLQYIAAAVTTLVGIPCNSLAFFYFTLTADTGLGKSTVYLYTAISGTDLVIAITAVPLALPLFIGDYQHPEVVCEVTEFILDLTLRFSFLLITVLSTVRCLTIRNPLRPPKYNVIRLVVMLFGLYFTLQSLVRPIGRIVTQQKCPSNFFKQYPPADVLWYVCTVFIGCTTCLLIVFTANFISIYTLLHEEGSAEDSLRVKAARTTVLFTMVYVVLHLPGVVYSSGRSLGFLGANREFGYAANALILLSPAVQAAIYFLRFPKLWLFWRGVMARAKTRDIPMRTLPYTVPTGGNSRSRATSRSSSVPSFVPTGANPRPRTSSSGVNPRPTCSSNNL